MTDSARNEGEAASSGPRYVRIQKTLEERLTAGAYPVGSLMPTESELAAEFGTSRFTIREALRYLSEHGYVERRQGVGTRVIATRPQTRFYQTFRSLQELFQVAVDTWFVIMDTRLISLSAEEAERVGGVAGEEWYRVDGVRWTEPGGKPLCYIQSYVPLHFRDVVAKFPEHEGPFFALLEQHADGPIQEAVQEIRALPMPPAIGRSLGLRPGSWALQLLRRYVTDSGVLIASFNWHPADQMTYVMRIQRSTQSSEPPSATKR